MVAFMTAMKKAASYVRRYGWIALLGIVAIALLVMGFTSGSNKLVSRLWSMIARERELHEEYVSNLNTIRDAELAASKRAAERAIDAVKAATEQYAMRNEELTKKKQREIESLVKSHSDDPDALTALLAERFGFEYVPR